MKFYLLALKSREAWALRGQPLPQYLMELVRPRLSRRRGTNVFISIAWGGESNTQ